MDKENSSDKIMASEIVENLAVLRVELHKRIIGQDDVINDLLACFLAGGHALLIGVPGLAKTTLIATLAECLALDFNRVQFTPDLMPADITGSEILFEDRTTGNREFRFVNGPLFSNIVLADEINRTPPKTQSALLQAMQEHQVTSSGKTYNLPKPFWVLATQNPIEQEGTYPLPEAQLDRFMFSIKINYPSAEIEHEIVKQTTMPIKQSITAVISKEQLISFRNLILRVPVADSVISFAVALARATRAGEKECLTEIKNLLTWGAGPRASQFLILAAKAYAVIDGRPTPDIEDVKRASHPVLQHRIVRSFNAEVENISAGDIIKMIVDRTPIPSARTL